jgi:hypothetical protein
MKICYISLGSFCHPKIIIRELKKEISESLPFDFNSSPSMNGITNILEELHKNKRYNLKLNSIEGTHNQNEDNIEELIVNEKNMYLLHFFKKSDLNKKIDNFPVSIDDYINKDIITNVKDKFKKRFDKLYKILNDKNNLLCFLRIENYENSNWKEELSKLTKVLSLFKNPNKYLIYTQSLIDDHLHYENSKVLNYDYNFPILFYKYYFYDKDFFYKKYLFTGLLDTFENIVNGNNIIHIKNNNIIEKYYINDNFTIFKLTNMRYFSTYFIENDILFINSVINEYEKYKKINGIFEKIYDH